MAQITLRPAEATESDGRLFAQYTETAAHGLMRVVFGKRYERILASAFQHPGHDMSYEHTVFAEIDGEIVGMAAACSGEDMRNSSNRPVFAAAGIHVVRAALVSIAGWKLFQFIRTVPDDDFYLAAIAVDDGHRGAGLGSALLEDVEHRAREAGCNRLALDVALDNPRAKALYERRGMVVEAQSPVVRWMPDEGVYRMVKDL